MAPMQVGILSRLTRFLCRQAAGEGLGQDGRDRCLRAFDFLRRRTVALHALGDPRMVSMGTTHGVVAARSPTRSGVRLVAGDLLFELIDQPF